MSLSKRVGLTFGAFFFALLIIPQLVFAGGPRAATPLADPVVEPVVAGDSVKSVKCKPESQLPCSYECPTNKTCTITLTVNTGGTPPISRESFTVQGGHVETITGGGGLLSSSMTY